MGSMGTPSVDGGGGGGSFAPVRGLSRGGQYEVIATSTLSNSYATGGDTVTLPGEVSGKDLLGLEILNWNDGTRMYVWDGSVSAPKIKSLTALPATQSTAATDLSAVILRIRFTFAG